jgi:hypothetical protein
VVGFKVGPWLDTTDGLVDPVMLGDEDVTAILGDKVVIDPPIPAVGTWDGDPEAINNIPMHSNPSTQQYVQQVQVISSQSADN